MALFSLQLKPLTLSELFHCHMNSHGPELTHMSFFFFFFCKLMQTGESGRTCLEAGLSLCHSDMILIL